MTNSADATLAAFGGKSSVAVVPGFYRGLDGLRAIVDFGEGRVPADLAMGVMPEVNDSVWIMTIDGKQPIVLGWTVPKPGGGEVVSVDGDLATVDTGSLGLVTAPFGFTVSAGDLVKLYWNNGPFIISPMSTTPDPGVDPGAPGAGGGEQTQVFTATESGSYRGRWWTPQVRAGDSNQGMWTYGSKIPGTIPASATILSVEIYISPVSIAGSAPIFAVHGYGSVSGAPAPSYGPSAAVGVAGGWVALPTSFGDLLKSGGGYLGVGVNHGGNSIFNAVSADGLSGALRIRYRT